MVNRVPASMREAWSFFDKSAEMKLTDYLKIIKDTAKGKGNWSEVLQNQNDIKETESSIFFALTPRQRSILSLCTTGNSPQEIAKQLGISYSYVRKELSRAYAILLPEADQGSDLKTAAVLKYMELLRMS